MSHPDASSAGIWMSGGAPAVDSSNQLYVIHRQRYLRCETNTGTEPNDDYGDSLLKLFAVPKVLQYFTPSDQLGRLTNRHRLWRGRGAVVLVDLPAGSPVTHLVLGGGKDGSLYVLNRDTLGGFGDSAAVQQIGGRPRHLLHGSLLEQQLLPRRRRRVTQCLFAERDAAALYVELILHRHLRLAGRYTFGVRGRHPERHRVDTHNHAYCTEQSTACGPAVLHAYDATNVAKELWNSATTGNDAAGNAVKFTVPTIANGKVYVGRGATTPAGSTVVQFLRELDVMASSPTEALGRHALAGAPRCAAWMPFIASFYDLAGALARVHCQRHLGPAAEHSALLNRVNASAATANKTMARPATSDRLAPGTLTRPSTRGRRGSAGERRASQVPHAGGHDVAVEPEQAADHCNESKTNPEPT